MAAAESVAMMTSMGFDEAVCIAGLRKCGGDLGRAIDYASRLDAAATRLAKADVEVASFLNCLKRVATAFVGVARGARVPRAAPGLAQG